MKLRIVAKNNAFRIQRKVFVFWIDVHDYAQSLKQMYGAKPQNSDCFLWSYDGLANAEHDMSELVKLILKHKKHSRSRVVRSLDVSKEKDVFLENI